MMIPHCTVANEEITARSHPVRAVRFYYRFPRSRDDESHKLKLALPGSVA